MLYHLRFVQAKYIHKIQDYVTHGSDRVIWSFLTNVLTPDQVPIARAWLKAVDGEIRGVETGVHESFSFSSLSWAWSDYRF